MTFMALVKKGPFFMAIKFQLSLVITFMAFYDCVRTLFSFPLHKKLFYKCSIFFLYLSVTFIAVKLYPEVGQL